MKKITKEQVKEIREIYAEGNILIKDLAKQFNVSPNTIGYYLEENSKEKRRIKQREIYAKLSKEERREKCIKQKEYQKEYHKKRYNSDFEFAEKQRKRSREYKERKSQGIKDKKEEDL